MSLSSAIRSQIRRKKQERKELQDELKDLENARESLELFQRSLGNIRSDFHAASSGQSSSLQSLQSISDRCQSAQVYTEGMDDTLNGVGSKIVGVAFAGLSTMVAARLVWYEGQISWCKAKIKLVNQEINSLQAALAAALAAEAAEKAEKD